jgi:hypothetical protein
VEIALAFLLLQVHGKGTFTAKHTDHGLVEYVLGGMHLWVVLLHGFFVVTTSI